MNQNEQQAGTTQSDHLALCPYCGGPGQDDFIVDVSYIIECGWCGARTGCQDGPAEAIEAWNRRAVTLNVAPAVTLSDDDYAAIVRRYEDAGDVQNADIIRKQWDVARGGQVAAGMDLMARGDAGVAGVANIVGQHFVMGEAQDETKGAGDAGAAQTCRSSEDAQASPNPMCERKTGMLESEGYGKTGYVLRQPGKDREVVVSDGGAVSWFTLEQWNWLMFNRDHIEFEWPKPISQLVTSAKQAARKDHEVRTLVNTLRDVAIQYSGTQQLRARIAEVVLPFVQRADVLAPQSSQSEATTASAGTLSVMLWLYRRLPRCYGRPPHIEVVVERLARHTGTDVADYLAERGAAQHQQ